MAFPLTSEELWDEVVARVGSETRTEQLTSETADSHPRLNAAYVTAMGEAGLYLSKRVAWPPDSLPAPFDFDVISLTLDIDTAGADRRPAWIDKTAEQARKRLQDVAAGKAAFTDSDAGTAGGATLDAFDYNPPAPHGAFDRSDSRSEINRVLPDLFSVRGRRGGTEEM